MEKNLNYYLSLPYRVEVIPDPNEGGFALQCPELPGCATCAETIEDGLHAIADAKREWLAACLEDGIPIPEPATTGDYSREFPLIPAREIVFQNCTRFSSARAYTVCQIWNTFCFVSIVCQNPCSSALRNSPGLRTCP